MCWITITMISPDGRSQLITLPQKRSDQMHLQVFATSMCFRQHPEFFSSYHEICSCLCGERDLLVPVAKCQCLYPGVLLSQGEEDGNLWGEKILNGVYWDSRHPPKGSWAVHPHNSPAMLSRAGDWNGQIQSQLIPVSIVGTVASQSVRNSRQMGSLLDCWISNFFLWNYWEMKCSGIWECHGNQEVLEVEAFVGDVYANWTSDCSEDLY